MFGHSMGSFLLRTYLYTYHSDLAGAILSGTCWQPEALLPVAAVMCNREARRLGEHNHSPFLQSLAFGSYNKPFFPNRTPYDWVCSREEVVDAYAADPLCTWLPSIQLFSEMMMGIRMNQKRGNISRMKKDLPIYFFAGQLDPVGNMGNGVLKAVQAFKNVGMKNVSVELYPFMRHECHNEADRQKVFGDILLWIEANCK
jgi:alpha-beta hydrolase superfamily lysophospholipase